MINAQLRITKRINEDLPDGKVIEGQLLFLNSPDGAGKLIMLVDPDDAIAVNAQPRNSSVWVTDLITDTGHRVARDACGSGCYCGARLVEPR